MTGGYRLKPSQTAKKLTSSATEGNDPCYLLASSCPVSRPDLIDNLARCGLAIELPSFVPYYVHQMHGPMVLYFTSGPVRPYGYILFPDLSAIISSYLGNMNL
jgi:hypothetical protein